MGANSALESNLSNTETITSREIADITGKRHDHVMRDIRSIFSRLGVDASKFQDTYTSLQNKQINCYNLPRREADLLLTGYGPEIRAKVIDRWHGPATVATRVVAPVVEGPPTGFSLATRIVSPMADEPTMSSIEIADLTGKQHTNVLRDIRKMLAGLGLPELKFESGYLDAQNQYRVCFKLPRDLTETLITGYNIPLRHKVVVRLRELEAEVAKPAPVANLSDAAQLRGLLLGYTEKVIELEHQVGTQAVKIAQDAPKVQVFTKLVEQKGYINFQKFCTQLNLHQRKIKAWLRDIGWLRADQWEVNPLPTAKAVDAGYCQIKRFETETGKLVQQIVFTSKAEAYVELKAPDYVRKPVRKERKKAA